MVIQETTDYSIFKLDKFNLTVHRISMGAKKGLFHKLMVDDMKQNGWRKGSIITVDECYNVLDGNMRLLSAMEAGVPVRFKIVENVKRDYHNNYNTYLKNKHKYNRLSK